MSTAAVPFSPRRAVHRTPTVGEPYRRHAELRGSHGTIDGEPSGRRCGGTLRWVDVEGPIPVVGCDRCRYETGVLR